ncbi:MAG: M28 family peptidase [Phycisphaerales bacterium]
MKFVLLPANRTQLWRSLRRSLVIAIVLLGLPAAGVVWATSMPGDSFQGSPPPITEAQQAEVAAVGRDIVFIAEDIGPRHLLVAERLGETAAWMASRFAAAGFDVSRQTYAVGGVDVSNVIAERRGTTRPEEILIVGAHYDTVASTAGADDNGSGVVATLALADRLAAFAPERTLRFVGFVNEEPPWFGTDDMGAVRYARLCASRNETIVGMISLESIGYFDDAPGSQEYPRAFAWRYPDTGNFVAFVGNLRSSGFARDCIRRFRQHAAVPSEGVTAPGWITGLSFSDHRAFWEIGVPAIMVTGTAMFRNPHYHRPGDRHDVVDDERLWWVIDGMEPVIRELASPGG